MSVLTLSCFLAKFVRYIYEGEKFQDVFMIVFNGSMEYRVCICAASLVGKERSKETKWSYEIVEKAARVVGRARDYVRRM